MLFNFIIIIIVITIAFYTGRPSLADSWGVLAITWHFEFFCSTTVLCILEIKANLYYTHTAPGSHQLLITAIAIAS